MEPCPPRAENIVPPPTSTTSSSQHPVAPCPSFLYTTVPAFPWAPRLRDLNTSATHDRAKQESTRDLLEVDRSQTACQESAKERVEGAKHTKDVSTACAYIKQEVENHLEDSSAALLSDFAAHLEVVLQNAISSGETKGMAHVMAASGLQDLPEGLILPVILLSVNTLCSHARCCCVAQWILLPSLRRLQAPPTKGLSAAMAHLGEINPQALLDWCFSPLLAPPEAGIEVPPLTQHHSELLVKAIKDQTTIPKHLLPELIEAACACGSSSTGTLWTEQTVVVVQAAVDLRPDFSLETLARLSAALHGASGVLSPSIKLGKLILATIKSYALGCDENSRKLLQSAAHTNGTFMAKPALAALNAL